MDEKKGQILIIDDNEDLLRSLELLLKTEYSIIDTVSHPERIVQFINRKNYDAVLLDMNFHAGKTSGQEGLHWLGEIKKENSGLPVIMITAYGDVDLAVKATKIGAFDFIQKPWKAEKLLSTINAAVKFKNSLNEISALKQSNKAYSEELKGIDDVFLGKSRCILKLKETIEKVASTDANVLILGENGTGKELVAREIHKSSARSENIFVHVDLGAIQEQLFESELFGHRKGAFTDAKSDRQGRMELANSGTLFLDEIGNLPLHLQPKLLSALQNKTIHRVGDNKAISIDNRLICATNANLKSMIANNAFREDLYYRVNTVELTVPPLRERGKDIILLAEYFLNKFSKKYKKQNLDFADEAISKILSYTWPGNVRELKHTIEREVILANSQTLLLADLSMDKQKEKSSMHINTFNLEEIEKQVIKKALEIDNSNLSKVARNLGVSRTTLYKKLKKYDL